jgi:hypothetical protein
MTKEKGKPTDAGHPTPLSRTSPAHPCRRRSPAKLRRRLPARFLGLSGHPEPQSRRTQNQAVPFPSAGGTATLHDGCRRRNSGIRRGRTSARLPEPGANPSSGTAGRRRGRLRPPRAVRLALAVDLAAMGASARPRGPPSLPPRASSGTPLAGVLEGSPDAMDAAVSAG